MIKIRLHGERREIAEAIEQITEVFEILSKSGSYADRGTSKYERVYLDCKIKKKVPEDFDEWFEKHPEAVIQGGGIDD